MILLNRHWSYVIAETIKAHKRCNIYLYFTKRVFLEIKKCRRQDFQRKYLEISKANISLVCDSLRLEAPHWQKIATVINWNHIYNRVAHIAWMMYECHMNFRWFIFTKFRLECLYIRANISRDKMLRHLRPSRECRATVNVIQKSNDRYTSDSQSCLQSVAD